MSTEYDSIIEKKSQTRKTTHAHKIHTRTRTRKNKRRTLAILAARARSSKTFADRTVRSSARNCRGDRWRLCVTAGGRTPRFGPQSARRTTTAVVSAVAAVERWRAECNHLFGGHPTGIRRRRLLCISNCGGCDAAE